MPTYTYRCDGDCETCGGVKEIFQRMSDATLTQCPECDKAIRRVVSLPMRAVVNSGNLYGQVMDPLHPSESPSPLDRSIGGRLQFTRPRRLKNLSLRRT